MISTVNQCSVGACAPPRPEDVAHVTAALARAAVATEPFAYAVIEDFLPQGLADGLRDAADTGQGPGWTGDHTRASCYLTQSIGRPDGETGAGRRAAAALSARSVVEAARTLFDGHLEQDVPVNRLLIGLELMRDRRGFMLPPHTDGATRLIGCLVYLADPGDPEILGTRLYRPLDPTLPHRTKNAARWEDLEEATMAPYRRNLALIWVRSNRSYHGVPMNIVDRDRRALQWCIEHY